MLHPSCAILISDYPVLSLWHTNTHDEIVRPIDVSAGGEAALVVRPKFDVALIGIDTPTFAFIRALAAGHSLELSAEIAAALDSGSSSPPRWRRCSAPAPSSTYARGAPIRSNPVSSHEAEPMRDLIESTVDRFKAIPKT